jgi:hypothetical protein
MSICAEKAMIIDKIKNVNDENLIHVIKNMLM